MLEELGEKLDDLDGQFEKISEPRTHLTLRLRRALSWARKAHESWEDDDASFIFLWISFNSMYGEDTTDYSESTEQDSFRHFWERVVDLDPKKTVYSAMWDCWDVAMDKLINNQFVYRDFWKHTNGLPGYADWGKRLSREIEDAKLFFRRGDGIAASRLLLARLYVLRNQLHHGGATHAGKTNRDQVVAGAEVMAALIPPCIGVMIANPNANWGKPYYPPEWNRS